MRAPVAGIVSVGDVSLRIRPDEAVLLLDVGPGPYDLDFRHDGGRLTLLAAPGPRVDLGAFFPGARPLRGQLGEVEVRPVPADGAEGVVLVDDLVLRPRVEDGRWLFRLPIDRPVELLALWRTRGRVTGLHRSLVHNPRFLVGRGLDIGPELAPAGELAVALTGGVDAQVTAELTVDGLRTGLVVGEGVAGVRDGRPVGVSVPRPPAVAALEGVGLWVQGVAREVGDPLPGALTGRHVSLDAADVALSWPPPVEIFPAPGAVAGAPLLQRDRLSLGWRGAATEATYIDLQLWPRGCGAGAPWRIIGPAADGALYLPRPPGGDPLAQPLLLGRVELADVGLEYGDVFGEAPLDRARLARRAGSEHRRAARGAWRGGEPACAPHPRAGRYALYPLDEATCDAGGVAREAVIDRCGRVVPLADEEALRELACTRLEGDRATHAGGDRWALESEPDGSLRIARGNRGAWLVPLPADRVPAPPSLARRWYTIGITEQLRAYAGGRPGSALEDARQIVPRGTRGGPWLEIERSGRVRLAAPGLAFEGDLVAFDGVSGAVRVSAPGCRGVERRLALAVVDGELVLEELVPVDHDRVAARTIEIAP